MNATDRLPRSLRSLIAALVVLLVSSAACLAQTTEPVKATVADVIPVGNTHVPTQRVMSMIRTRPGAEYNASVVDEDVRRLYQSKLFNDVKVRLQDGDKNNGTIIVYFELKEHPNTIQEIIYIGAEHLNDEDLETITGLRKGQPLNPVANQIARQNLLRKYVQESGRLHATVELLEGDKSTDSRVVFRITEGPKVKVSSISFTGVNFVTEGRIRTQVNTSRAFLGMLGGEYNPQIVDGDVSKLIEYYKTFGFMDVRVSRELQWDSDYSRVKLIFHVEEGARYRFGNVQLVGPDRLPREQMVTYIKAENGKFYDESVVKADLAVLKDFRGYSGVDAVAQRNLTFKENGEVDVQYKVEEREPATVGQVIIVGNTVTRQSVILRQLPIYPGQILSYPDLRVGERNLTRLGIFQSDGEKGIRPTVEVLDPDGPNRVKDVLVNVQEDRTGSLMFGVGVNSDAGVQGSIVLNERNFDILRPPTSLDDLLSGRAWRGAGQEFRLEAVPGTQLQRYTASWREPFLFDSPWSLGVSVYYYDRVFNEDTETRVGGKVTLGRRFGDYWQLSETLRVEGIGIHDLSAFAPVDYTSVDGTNFLVGLKTTLQHDTRDSYLRPTEGHMAEVSFEECLGTYTFPVVSGEFNQFWPVWQRADGSGRFVLAGRSEVGWCGPNTPVYERFYAGGFHSMRGFEFRGVGPDVDTFKVGGDFMWLNSLEFQIPVLANDHLYFVTFVDSGTVESNTKIGDYRVAVGAGARIVVPMLGPVPIALDFGFPLHQAPSDNKQVFSFWLGFWH